MRTIGRRAYAEMYGPTVGDRVRLADTGLIIEVEKDFTLNAGAYGEEVKFGGGKTIRPPPHLNPTKLIINFSVFISLRT